LHNFFINKNQIENDTAIIVGKDVNHIKNVLRMEIHEKIIITSIEDKTSYESEILDIQNEGILCKLLTKRETTEPEIEVSLFQGIPKFDKMELIIEKAVELGVSEIYPVEMQFSIAKIKDEKKIERWNKISESAAKQSKRNIVPQVHSAIKYDKLKDVMQEYDLFIICYENEQTKSIKEILQKHKTDKINKIGILVGPEGGISPSEIELLNNDVEVVSLGKRILRTETAGLVILSMIMYEFEL